MPLGKTDVIDHNAGGGGENETINPVAGHISGAVSAPYAENLGPDGRFLSPEELRSRYQALLAKRRRPRPLSTVAPGSLMVQAGLPDACLYPGSWSEWITDSQRPQVGG